MSGITATWPAPPSASPWHGFAVQAVPPAPAARRSSVTSARLSARSAKRAAWRPKVQSVYGVAAEFGASVVPEYLGSFPAGTEIVMTRAAVRRSVEAIQDGRQRAALTLGHGGDEIGSSGDGTFLLWLGQGELSVKVRSDTASGRAALAVLKVHPHRALSIGFKLLEWVELSRNPLRVRATRARIYEIAIVPRGACPSARLFL